MQDPKTLTGEALCFYQSLAPQLRELGILTDLTRHAFILLCQLWGKVQETEDLDTIKYVALSKQVQNLMKQFGLDPLSKKRLLGGEQKAKPRKDAFAE